MINGFKIGDIELTWLNGGRFELDGGTMFGVVPKALWSKKYPCNDDNYIPMAAWPILVRTSKALVIIESGLGNKMSEKQKQIFRVKEDWNITGELDKLGLTCQDIDFVVLTHYDFDHAGGVVSKDKKGKLELTFPNARHIVQKNEWYDVANPNRRSINTFWPVNYETLRDSGNLELVEGEQEITEGIKVMLTAGHNGGHQVVVIESGDDTAIHMGDLMPTHAHYNPLWVMAYDNFPLDSITQKEKLEAVALERNAWLTFYHDPFVLAAKFDRNGNIIERLSP